MNDRSFLKFGGIAGILLALTSWTTVAVFFLLVPAAQRVPITDVKAFLDSIGQNSSPTQWYYALYALIAVWAFVGIVAVYFQLRTLSESWTLFATLLAGIAAVLTVVNGLQQVAFFRYLGPLYNTNPQIAQALLSMPAPLNPLNAITQGLTAPWFLIIGILMLRSDLPKLLAVLGFVAFADLAVGFFASLFGIDLIPTLTAVIAGGVGGPVFWLWMGIELYKRAEPSTVKQTMPKMAVAK